jgi:cardiolipin synthase
MTASNFITSIRIILTPVLIIYLINDEHFIALVLFVLASLSDAADGLIARLFDQKSKLGAFLDPLADKILLVATFVVLSVKDFIPSWFTVVVISRDILILLGVLILFLNNEDFTIRPSILSKITTCLQLATVFLVLSLNHFASSPQFNDIAEKMQDNLSYVFWFTAILTITSCLHYMRHWFRMMGEGPLKD